MSIFRPLLLLLAVALLGFAPAPFPKKERGSPQDDLDRLQGRWKLVEQGFRGRPSPAPVGGARIRRNSWTFTHNGEDGPKYTIALNQNLSPRAFEWKGGSTFLGSYKIEGRRLTIVYASGSLKEPHKRPTDLTGKDGHYLQYERE